MTKTNIAKRIVSIVLAMSIVLSFALVSVSAIPADYTVVDGKYEKHGFEEGDSWSISVVGGTCALEASDDKAYAGDKSLKLTVAEGKTLFKIRFTPSTAKFEANCTYYLSFWYYSDVWAGDTTIWDHTSTKNISFTPGVAGQWNKAVAKITTDQTGMEQYFSIGGYNTVNGGDVVYIDELEIAKVANFNLKQTTVPEGATAVVTGIKDFDTDASTGIGNALSIKSGEATKVGVTMEEAHWGERSYAIQGNTGNTGSATFYFHPRLLMPAYKDCDDVLPVGTYYFSYYVYSDVAVSTRAYSNAGSFIAPTQATAGQWSKAEGVITIAEEKTNSGILEIAVDNLGENAVYFDDFILAQITVDGAVALTAEEVVFDYDTMENATVTFTSPIGLKSAEVTAPEGVTVESATVVGDELVVALSGVELSSEYELAVTGVDLFSRAYDVVAAFETPVAEAAPMSFVASSIRDGATVAAPVSTIYLDVEYALDPATLAGNVTIAGENATVVAAALVNDNKTIKVTLDGVLPAESYTLSVDDVENTYGGVLTDSITFSTKAGDSYAIDFEGATEAEGIPADKFAWKQVKNGKGEDTYEWADVAYTGSKSIKLVPTDLALGYAAAELRSLKPGTEYRVSFYFKTNFWGRVIAASGDSVWGSPVFTDAENGWVKCEVPLTATGATATMSLYNFWKAPNQEVIYIDDLKVQEVGTVSQPIMKNGSRYVSELEPGTTTIEIPVANANAKAYMVSYDAQGRMVDFTPATVAGGAINLEWTAEDALYTKIIVMDATTFAPLCDAFEFNK